MPADLPGDLADDLDAVRATATYADRRAEAVPGRPALVDGRRSLTWAEVAAESDRLAAGLADQVEPGATVYAQLYNCVELFVLRLAGEKAGVRLLTAPRTFRRNEVAPLFEQLEPTLAVVPGTYRGVDYVELVRAVDTGSVDRVASLDGSGDLEFGALLADPEAGRAFESRADPDRVSQLALTSGSSGTPTCVAVAPAPRIRTAIVQARRYDLRGEDAVGVVTPLVSGAPDATAYHGAPVFGGTVVLYDRFDPERVGEGIRTDVTVLPVVPTVTTKLLAAAGSEEADYRLRTIINYGDALAESVGRRAESTFDCRVQQAFGTADYGGIAATATDDGGPARFRTVGRPLPGNDVALETDDGVVTDPDPGVVGTLLVDGVHRVGRPLVGSVESVGAYFRVNVRATFDDAGRVVLLGRGSDVIIRGGRNVYPAEIEDALLAHPSIARAAVVGVPDEALGERPYAFVVPADGAPVDDDAVLAFLEAERGLAPFKLPEWVEAVDALPLVPAGHKVDKATLRDRAAARVGGADP